ncbi:MULTISPECIES: hypothetical protein [unclassified Endozoicomonas]|uniref:hypothetical protein n=1 Tax=unclassified Endozoicomonas TaxID=2644528 RepID=UPI003BAE7046
MAISPKEAAQAAAKYFEDVSSERVRLSIEEVELEDGFWLITLGMSDSYALGSIGNKVTSYKIFKVDANTGEVISMKIRKI